MVQTSRQIIDNYGSEWGYETIPFYGKTTDVGLVLSQLVAANPKPFRMESLKSDWSESGLMARLKRTFPVNAVRACSAQTVSKAVAVLYYSSSTGSKFIHEGEEVGGGARSFFLNRNFIARDALRAVLPAVANGPSSSSSSASSTLTSSST